MKWKDWAGRIWSLVDEDDIILAQVAVTDDLLDIWSVWIYIPDYIDPHGDLYYHEILFRRFNSLEVAKQITLEALS